MSSALSQWEQEQERLGRRLLRMVWASVGTPMRGLVLAAIGFTMGMYTTSAAGGSGSEPFLGKRLRDTEITLKARQGELELARLELERVQAVMRYSTQYRIPADLAAEIYDIALSEGIDPRLAYRLVRVESGFFHRAISPVGAVGLTQVMPATARELDPTLAYADLFHQETNLRLGFRYLRLMLDKYQGDMRLALLAYNRGPGTVDKIRRTGGDPANGYEVAVMGNQP